MSAAHKESQFNPVASHNGVDHYLGAGAAGKSLQSLTAAQAGASPYVVVFADHGLSDMADGSYTVVSSGGTDTANHGIASFEVTGGVDLQVLNLLIVGQLQNQKA